jgi:hypothetical protein
MKREDRATSLVDKRGKGRLSRLLLGACPVIALCCTDLWRGFCRMQGGKLSSSLLEVALGAEDVQ